MALAYDFVFFVGLIPFTPYVFGIYILCVILPFYFHLHLISIACLLIPLMDRNSCMVVFEYWQQ